MDTTHFGALCLLPPLIVIIIAIASKRAFEPLLIGSFVGYLIIDRANAFTLFSDAISKALKDDSMVWIILVCGMYGSVIELLVRSGATIAFGNFATQFIKTKKQALLTSWLMGFVMFLDDYMSALSVGNTMKNITDKYQISRPLLAYMVNTMAAPVCVIVPLSTWSIYSGKLIAKEMHWNESDWFGAYWHTIPYVFYGWVAVLVALLVALGIFPLIGKMRELDKLPIAEVEIKNINDKKTNERARYYDFFIPLIVIVAATVYFDIDALKGIYIGLAFTIAYFWLRKLMDYNTIFEGGFEGFKSMIFALAILTVTYVLKDVGDKMGLTPYVIESIKPIVSKEWLAALVFLSMGFIAYTTASSWGLYLVAIPIVVPLANALGANVWLCLGAVISSGAFGSNASLYSDCTVLTSNSCEVNSVQHSLSQLPYALISVALATVMYVVMGYM
jgi:tetracycline resistance efflux pump